MSSAETFIERLYVCGSAEQLLFAVMLPECVSSASQLCPGRHAPAVSHLQVVYFLSGLTCTWENFTSKAGAYSTAERLGMIIVAPDTSPRGADIDRKSDSWDFGAGAGFYVDATEPEWAPHFRMYSYITRELPALVTSCFPVDSARTSIMGHSMGGLGALTIALRNPGVYKCASAFSPICHPSVCPWGIKAFTGYLGADRETWKAYDPMELVKTYAGPDLHLLLDQGDADNFLSDGQLNPDHFVNAAREAGVPVTYLSRPGYDHSYYYISTFIAEHLEHHAKFLKE